MTSSDPSGFVFDIQRFSLHDGPGIRTTVFLQGCPLRCIWCHNPEGQSLGPAISFRPEICQFCRSCELVCEPGAHIFSDGQHKIDRTICDRCGKCAEVCAFGALKVTGERRSSSQVMSVVLRDRPYYGASGGGLTLSGGEPLFQAAFSRALLRMAKDAGIHTCVETCGQVSRPTLEKALPVVDLFLYDIKTVDPQRHRTLTGVDPRRILTNLEYLERQGAAVRLRFPLVPGVNDAPEDLKALAGLARRFSQVQGVDIMPYHNLGHQKYLRFGLQDPLPGISNPSEEIKNNWLATLKAFGCEKAVLA